MTFYSLKLRRMVIFDTVLAFFQWSLDNKAVKVDKWDGCAVKNALDDGVRKVSQ